MPKDNNETYPKRTLQEHNGQYSINIPKSIALAKGWGRGTRLSLKLDVNGNLVIFSSSLSI